MPGYEAKFVHPLLKRHECPICLFVVRNPMQTECGHLFCRECLEPILKRRRPICPLDKEDISLEGIFPDNACRREILNLDVYCNFMTSGCTWIGPLKELKDHIELCDYREVQCPQCGQYVQVHVLIKHKETDCPMRPEICPHCRKEVPSQQMQAHADKVCLEILCSCPNGCDFPQMKLSELERHLAIKGGQCPLSEMGCPFKPYGCSIVSLRKNITTHLEQYSEFHNQILTNCLIELKQQVEKNTAAIQDLLERVTSLEIQLNAVKRLQDVLEQRVQLLNDQTQQHSNHYEGIEDYPDDSHQPITFENHPIAASTDESDGIECNFDMNTSSQNTIGNNGSRSALVSGQLRIPNEILSDDLPPPPNDVENDLDTQYAVPIEGSINQELIQQAQPE